MQKVGATSKASLLICRRGPILTNLLFADDSLLFCRATFEECAKVLNILEDYEHALGYKVNKTRWPCFLVNLH